MSDFWNKRYAENEFAYGEQPNEFFAAQLALLPTGSIILPCEGEGRNAVYAAKAGWKVEAFDYSREGLKKAEALMRQKGVTLNYSIYNVWEAAYPANTFDAVALIYAHLPVAERCLLHTKCIGCHPHPWKDLQKRQR